MKTRVSRIKDSVRYIVEFTGFNRRRRRWTEAQARQTGLRRMKPKATGTDKRNARHLSKLRRKQKYGGKAP